MRDLLNYEDEMICPTCNSFGRIKKREKTISDLKLPEFKNLMVDCFEMLKKRETDTSVKEYDKITTKRVVVDDISTRGGVPVPKEY